MIIIPVEIIIVDQIILTSDALIVYFQLRFLKYFVVSKYYLYFIIIYLYMLILWSNVKICRLLLEENIVYDAVILT